MFQGSILGPLLFIVYVNDMPDISKHIKVSCYADDTTRYLTGPSILYFQHEIHEDSASGSREIKESINVRVGERLFIKPACLFSTIRYKSLT